MKGGRECGEEEEEEEEEEAYSGANAVNEEDPERDRATQEQKTRSAVLRSRGRLTPIPPGYGTA